MKSFEVSHSTWKGTHLNSTYLFIKQIGAGVQIKEIEESVNKTSWQVDLEDQILTFLSTESAYTNTGGMEICHWPEPNCHHFIVIFQSSLNSLGICK